MKKIENKLEYHKPYYSDYPGINPPIVFIHGLGCSSTYDYSEVSQSEKIKNRKILIDLFGFGESDKPSTFSYTIIDHAKIVYNLLNELSIEKYHVFGHSMGGAIAIELCNLDLGRVVSIIITEGNLDNGGGPTSLKIARTNESEFLKFGFSNIIENSKLNGNIKWARTLSMSSPKAVYLSAKSLAEGAVPTWRDRFYKFPFKKTYIYGERNINNLDIKNLETNGINVGVVVNAGHNMVHDNPEGLILEIEKGICT